MAGAKGIEEAKRALRKKVQDARRAQRRALARVGTKGVAILKSRVPVRTGMAKRSLGKRVGTSRRTGASYVVIGPRRRFSATIETTNGKTVASISANGKVKSVNLRGVTVKGKRKVTATKYFHLIEKRNKRSSGYRMMATTRTQLAAMAKAEVKAELAK